MKLGAISYKRTYYQSKDGKRYRYLVDEILGIEVHTRMDEEMHAELAEVSSDLSYRKAGKSVGDIEISGQAAMQSVRRIEHLKLEKLLVEKKTVEVLYVEADEDHIALQSGKSAMPRLIYVHEGIDMQGNRRSLKSPYYIASLKGKPGDLWQETYEYIEDNYDIDKIQQIYLSGDGAAWIKQGLDYLPKAKFVLDKYHMNKKEDKMYSITKKLMRSTHQGLKSKINERSCDFEVFRIGKVTGLYKALKAI